jgi:CheY-like chemotaxis protein
MSAPRTILVVDDDVDFVAIARASLEGAGYRVVAEEAAGAGLETARREQPELILLDLMMEETDSGVRLARELRREQETRDIPIAILTAVRQVRGFDFAPNTREDYDWIGADAWVEKPIAPAELVKLAERLLGESGEEKR